MNRRSNITVIESETVATMIRVGLIGKASIVQRAIKPIAAAISGKHSPGAIAAMCGGGQANDQ